MDGMLIVTVVGFVLVISGLGFTLKQLSRLSYRVELLHSAIVGFKGEIRENFDHTTNLLVSTSETISLLKPPQPRENGKFIPSPPKAERARSMSEARLMAENGLIGSAEREG